MKNKIGWLLLYLHMQIYNKASINVYTYPICTLIYKWNMTTGFIYTQVYMFLQIGIVQCSLTMYSFVY